MSEDPKQETTIQDPLKVDTIARRLKEVASALQEYSGTVARGNEPLAVANCLLSDSNYLRNISTALSAALVALPVATWTNICDVERIEPGQYLVLFRTSPFNWIQQSSGSYSYKGGWEVHDPGGRGILMMATVKYFAPFPAVPQDVLDEWARRDSEAGK